MNHLCSLSVKIRMGTGKNENAKTGMTYPIYGVRGLIKINE